MSNHWTTDSARHTYAVPHWGDGYVDVSAAGEIVMRPRGTGGPALSLPQIVERARAEGLRLPLLVRFPDILADRLARLQDAFAHKVVPGLAGDAFDNCCGDVVCVVVVNEPRPQFGRRWQVAQAAKTVFEGEVSPVAEQVGPREAGAVAEQVANRDVIGQIIRGELEIGQVPDDGVVPLQAAFVDQDRK